MIVRGSSLVAAALALACGKTESKQAPADADAGAGGGGASTQTSGGEAVQTSSTTGGTVELTPASGCAQQLASGDGHTCVLYSDGRVSCFGANGFGQLGTGDTQDPSALAAVPLESVQRIAAGGNHTCAADDSSILCWGDNRASQLGVDGIEQSPTPVSVVPTPHGLVQLELGDQHGCYVDWSAHGYCWGTGSAGAPIATPSQDPRIGNQSYEFVQLGGGLTRLVRGELLYDLSWASFGEGPSPPPADAPAGVLQNAIAADHDCILRRSGSVWCRGEGYEPFYVAVADFGDDVVQVEVSNGFDCALTRETEVLCRGRNDAAQLGNGTLTDAAVAEEVAVIGGALEISLAAQHACARLRDGSVYCWGAPPGLGVLTFPERFAGPTSDAPCEAVPSTPRPWDLPFPEASGAVELTDGIIAFGQNLCRCSFSDSEEIEACIAGDKVRVLTGCFEALGRNLLDETMCKAHEAWFAAECSAMCVQGGGIPEDCGWSLHENGCEASGGVFEFCERSSLGCDGPMSETRVSWSETCNGVADCENGFDEANCLPNAGVFVCADGSTVSPDRVADASEDCPDGSDEWLP